MRAEQTRRCEWCGESPLYVEYHDSEWGKPSQGDRILFEFIVLESAQSGLSWITILKKREGYREAFSDFDPVKVSAYGPERVEELMNNPAIVRNRKKIESAINNSKRFIEVQKEFGSFRSYIENFVPRPIINHWKKIEENPASTPLSDQISRDMKKRGFTFFGSVVCYSFLQATGFVNDHIDGCDFK